MLSYQTVEPHTLELLRKLMAHPLLSSTRLASPCDIAAMKINAIEGRGTKKDFIDMYFLLQHYSLKEVLDFYARKYPENSMFRALMSLSYFEDAEEQIMPKMFSSVTWEDMKQFITAQVSRL